MLHLVLLFGHPRKGPSRQITDQRDGFPGISSLNRVPRSQVKRRDTQRGQDLVTSAFGAET